MERSGLGRKHIGFEEALSLAMAHVSPLSAESRLVAEAVGRVAAGETRASVDSPSVDASVKDGYAVVSRDVAAAERARPVELKFAGTVGAGDAPEVAVVPGTAVRILSGAAIPPGADAVLAEEFAEADTDVVRAFADAHPGRNILGRGTDVRAGEVLARPG
jgi:molybdopterin molybdotransferase